MKDIKPLKDTILMKMVEVKPKAFETTKNGLIIPKAELNPGEQEPATLHAKIVEIGENAKEIAKDRGFEEDDFVMYNQYNAMKFMDKDPDNPTKTVTWVIIKPEDVWGKYKV